MKNLEVAINPGATVFPYSEARQYLFRVLSERLPPDLQKFAETLVNLHLDEKNFPIFLHCAHGEDRTGLLMGLYRVEVQGWTPEKAYLEMLKLGFHPKFKALDDYFRDRTGFH